MLLFIHYIIIIILLAIIIIIVCLLCSEMKELFKYVHADNTAEKGKESFVENNDHIICSFGRELDGKTTERYHTIFEYRVVLLLH